MNVQPDESYEYEGPNWYALYTRHQHEKKVKQILDTKGFETFLPLYAALQKWKDRAKVVHFPLFPCYVFIQGGLDRRLDIITTLGIHSLVSIAGEPAAIPSGEIAAIRRAINTGSRVEPHPFLQCGERVRVRCGPLEGIRGILIRKKNTDRLVLCVEMLGKAASVEIDALLIERVNDTPGIHSVTYPMASSSGARSS